MFGSIKDIILGKAPLGSSRSSQWPKVRLAHLATQPTCAVCGGKSKLQVHHRVPFHLNPALELDPTNLITLCESGKGGVNCHLFFGHLGNFSAFNPQVTTDSATWRKKVKDRPTSIGA